MVERTYAIRVSSEAAGVGRTSIAINLAAALSSFRRRTLLIDADIANPTLGQNLGLEANEVGTGEVMLGRVKAEDAIVRYKSIYLDVMPFALKTKRFIPTNKQVDRVGSELEKMGYDFVIFDTSPGIVSTHALLYYNEVLLVTTVDNAPIASTVKLVKAYDKFRLARNFVINRFNHKKYNILIDKVERVYGRKALEVIPEDSTVRNSEAKQTPAYLLNKNSMFSKKIASLARHYLQ